MLIVCEEYTVLYFKLIFKQDKQAQLPNKWYYARIIFGLNPLTCIRKTAE